MGHVFAATATFWVSANIAVTPALSDEYPDPPTFRVQ